MILRHFKNLIHLFKPGILENIIFTMVQRVFLNPFLWFVGDACNVIIQLTEVGGRERYFKIIETVWISVFYCLRRT